MVKKRKSSVKPPKVTEIPKENQPELLVNQTSKWKNWWTRFFWTWVMIGAFLGILMSGPMYVIILVGMIQVLVYREVITIGIQTPKEMNLPWMRFLHWYFLFTTNYFLYGESLIYYYKPIVLVDAFLMPLATHHRFISFTLYITGIVIFVLNLKKGFYKFQFTYFGWTHMALLLIIVESHFIISNIFEGLIWLVLPSSLVIVNDIFAYVAGFFFGKTPLIKLSPKKTWEGFIGGLIVTLIFAFFIAGILAQMPYMTCSLRQIGLSNATQVTKCDIHHVFLPRVYRLYPEITAAFRLVLTPLHSAFPKLVPNAIIRSITLLPIQLHAVVFGLFASLIAPFGGFFASGFKRAFNIKDFSDSIPGHGGLTDRMDCQFLMGVFASMYYSSFIGNSGVDVGVALEFALQNLKKEELVELYQGLGEYLTQQGLLP